MNRKIQSAKLDAEQKVIAIAEAKKAQLDPFIERATGAEIILKLDKDNDKGNKIATIRIDAPGDDLIAESRCKTFEEAIDTAIDALKKQIERYKERYNK